MGLSWRKIREAFATRILTVTPTATVKDEWPYDFSQGDSLVGLNDATNPDRVHAYLIGSMKAEALEEKVGGGPDHGSILSTLTLRFMGILGLSQGTTALSSADEFEAELKAIRYEVLNKRRDLGIVDPDVSDIRRIYPISYDDIYTDDYNGALIHIAEGSLVIELTERW